MPTPLENLQFLRNLLAATPAAHINLDTVGYTDAPCGTIACVVGTAALHPYFNAQGLNVTKSECNALHLTLHGQHTDYSSDSLCALFGPNSAELFQPYGSGPERNVFRCDSYADKVYDHNDDTLTHKEVALWRLDCAIKGM